VQQRAGSAKGRHSFNQADWLLEDQKQKFQAIVPQRNWLKASAVHLKVSGRFHQS
jgi:hypothetical protein